MPSDLASIESDLRSLAIAVSKRIPGGAPNVNAQLTRWTFDRAGRWSHIAPDPRTEWDYLAHYDWLKTFEQYERIERACRESAALVRKAKSYFTNDDAEATLTSGLNVLIRDLVLDAFEPGTFIYSESRFHEASLRLTAMSSAKVRHHVLAFLDTIGVGPACDLDGLQLRAPTHAELVEVFNLAGVGTRYDAATHCEAVIEGFEVTSDVNDSVLGDRVGALITALRIWTGLPVASIATYRAPNTNALRGSVLPAWRSWFDLTTATRLSNSDGFPEFYRRVRDVLQRPPEALAVALRRLQLMVESERGADRLLDLYIILEALFQLGDEKQELAYRLSLRTAHFAGTDLDSRKYINKMIKTGYGLRSRIAHGSRPDSDDQELQRNIEQIVNEALRQYCQRAALFANDRAHKALIEEIDGYLLERRGDA